MKSSRVAEPQLTADSECRVLSVWASVWCNGQRVICRADTMSMGCNSKTNEKQFNFSLNIESLLISVAVNSGVACWYNLNEIADSYFTLPVEYVLYNASGFVRPVIMSHTTQRQ